MTSSPHNMRIPDELWELVVAEANSRAEHIKAVDASYARYPRTRIVIDALIARYRDKLPANYVPAVENLNIPAWGSPPVTLVPCEASVTEHTAGFRIEENRNSNPPPDPGHKARY
jgi:hypothetical protein